MRRLFSQKFLITGASGQIGQELIPYMYSRYGPEALVVSDLNKVRYHVKKQPKFVKLDVTNEKRFKKVVEEVKPTHILHLAAFLSAKAEKDVVKSLAVNIGGLNLALELARQYNLSIYSPSSIAAFGPDSPRNPTPEDCISKPTTVYGVSKVFTELLGTYYHKKFGVDFRCLRYPGAISVARPTGGTTDYAVEIFYELLEKGKYDCFLKEDTRLPMMYMDDLLRGTFEFIDAPSDKLTRRVYNLAAISFTPSELFTEIKKHIPAATVTYTPDIRQQYADSWPMVLEDQLARKDWGWNHKFGLEELVKTMIKEVKKVVKKAEKKAGEAKKEG